jgi:hypothetical protein
MTTAAGQQLPLWSARSAEADWRVRRSARARRMVVRVFHDGAVEVVVPERARPREVQSFVAHHLDWIGRERRRASLLPTYFPPDRLELKAIGESWCCRAVRLVAPSRGPLQEIESTSAGGTLALDLNADRHDLAAAALAWLSARARAASRAAGFAGGRPGLRLP